MKELKTLLEASVLGDIDTQLSQADAAIDENFPKKKFVRHPSKGGVCRTIDWPCKRMLLNNLEYIEKVYRHAIFVPHNTISKLNDITGIAFDACKSGLGTFYIEARYTGIQKGVLAHVGPDARLLSDDSFETMKEAENAIYDIMLKMKDDRDFFRRWCEYAVSHTSGRNDEYPTYEEIIKL